MMKSKTKRKLCTLAMMLTLLVPLPVMAATSSFTDFKFTANAYQEKQSAVTSAVKDGGSDYETKWYYRITKASGVGAAETGKVVFLEPNYSGSGSVSIAVPATISTGTPLNTVLNADYYEDCPAGKTYTLYVSSNPAYSKSISVVISGKFTP